MVADVYAWTHIYIYIYTYVCIHGLPISPFHKISLGRQHACVMQTYQAYLPKLRSCILPTHVVSQMMENMSHGDSLVKVKDNKLCLDA